MEKLIEKYPALIIPLAYAQLIDDLESRNIMETHDMDKLYSDFKSNIFCIGLDPSEYEKVIKWFCDTMEY